MQIKRVAAIDVHSSKEEWGLMHWWEIRSRVSRFWSKSSHGLQLRQLHSQPLPSCWSVYLRSHLLWCLWSCIKPNFIPGKSCRIAAVNQAETQKSQKFPVSRLSRANFQDCMETFQAARKLFRFSGKLTESKRKFQTGKSFHSNVIFGLDLGAVCSYMQKLSKWSSGQTRYKSTDESPWGIESQKMISQLWKVALTRWPKVPPSPVSGFHNCGAATTD